MKIGKKPLLTNGLVGSDGAVIGTLLSWEIQYFYM